MFVLPDHSAANARLSELGFVPTARRPKPVQIRDGVAFVQLSKSLEATVDVEDAPLVAALNWAAYERPGWTAYAVTGVRRPDGRPTALRLHRYLLTLREMDGIDVDHIDGNGLHNRRPNLRACTHAQNLRNRGLMRSNTSGYKGIYFDRCSGRWRAELRIDGRRKHVGYFDTAELAAAAYDAEALKLHGEFARTNEMLAA
ncbi:AP2 domain-containing protein [Xanthobacter sp. DSM 24535]|uniref:AP2 domain-containing protein n=1 Tax=Roseixanthobacter psychrophilus TaxID=3119917 RepID=UPI00372B796C